MAKFSFDDVDEDNPIASGGEKRKRDDGPADADAEAGEPLAARNLATGGREPAVSGEEATGQCDLAEETAGAEVEGSMNVQIDPDVLDCSICFESLRPPLFQVCTGIGYLGPASFH
ncbi:hypothetical protein ABZP36_012152 [Zizania latifolia]